MARAPTVLHLEPASEPEALTDVIPLLKRIVVAYGQVITAGLFGVDRSAVHHWLSGRAVSSVMRGGGFSALKRVPALQSTT